METKDEDLNERLTSGEDGKSHLISLIGGNVGLKLNFDLSFLFYINNNQS